MADDESIPIPAARLQRVMEALSYASVDALDDATALLSDPVEDEFGELEGFLGIFLTELQAARTLKAEQDAQRALIERQQVAIRDLSTPILDLWDGILTLPIVGVVDTQRAAEMMDRLLDRIAEQSARCVIIDVTGVSVVDTMTAASLIKMADAARLLGSYCVVSGIRPEVAQTLAHGDVDVGELKTVRSLREGLRACFLYLRHQQGEATAAAR